MRFSSVEPGRFDLASRIRIPFNSSLARSLFRGSLSLSLSVRCTEQQERFLSLSELYTHLAHFRRLEAGPLEHEDGAAGGGGRGGGLLLGRHGRGEAADHDLFCSLF